MQFRQGSSPLFWQQMDLPDAGSVGLPVSESWQMTKSGSVQQTEQGPFAKHLPGQHVLPHRCLPLAHGSAATLRVVAPRSAPASRARQAVRRDPGVLKRRVIRSKVWWFIAQIPYSKHADELGYIVMAKYASCRTRERPR
jgi:hypothetical protein